MDLFHKKKWHSLQHIRVCKGCVTTTTLFFLFLFAAKSYQVNCLHLPKTKRYWIEAAWEIIRQWENECSYFKRQKTPPSTQIMASLPDIRLKMPLRAFVHCAVDNAVLFLTILFFSKLSFSRLALYVVLKGIIIPYIMPSQFLVISLMKPV